MQWAAIQVDHQECSSGQRSREDTIQMLWEEWNTEWLSRREARKDDLKKRTTETHRKNKAYAMAVVHLLYSLEQPGHLTASFPSLLACFFSPSSFFPHFLPFPSFLSPFLPRNSCYMAQAGLELKILPAYLIYQKVGIIDMVHHILQRCFCCKQT